MQVCMRGNARLAAHRDRVVAVLAGDLVLAGMDVVAEVDRLARTLEGRRIRGRQHNAGRRRRLLCAGRPSDGRDRDDRRRTCTHRYPCRLPHYRFTAQGRTDRANAAAERRGTDKISIL